MKHNDKLMAVLGYMREFVGRKATKAVWFDRSRCRHRIPREEFYSVVDELVSMGEVAHSDHMYWARELS